MDLLKTLRSLEEFLYEVIVWLLFYPKTLWRIVIHPLQTLVYAEREASENTESQFADTMSPPLMLMISLGLSHLVELSSHIDVSQGGHAFARAILQNQQNLLIYRSIGFSVWPLVFATSILRRRRVAVDRSSLRGPFFAQCFLAAPFALGITFGTCLLNGSIIGRYSGGALIVATLVWYMFNQWRWVRRTLVVKGLTASLITAKNTLIGVAINLAIAYVLMKA